MKRIMVITLAILAATGLVFAAQHDYDIANGPGATVRADLNNLFTAIAQNNSGATAPTTTFANQWWMDTSTNLLKQRDNSNSAWVTVASKSGTTWIPYRAGSPIGTASLLTTDTDTGLTANSDSNAATQKAVKAYVDTGDANDLTTTGTNQIGGLSEKSTLVDGDWFLIEDSESSNAKKKVQRSNLGNTSRVVFTPTGSPHTWTAPTGVTFIKVTMCGGGGGGGGAGSSGGGGGGGAECINNHVYPVTPSSNYTVTVGTGGNGGAGGNGDVNSSNGAVGGTTSITGGGYSISVVGGNFGQKSSVRLGGAASTSSSTLTGNNGSDETGGAINSTRVSFAGGAGGDGVSGTGKAGGGGGNSYIGGGGGKGGNGSPSSPTNGSAGSGPGSGGGGAGGIDAGVGANGGAGGPGIVIISFAVPE